MVYGKLLPRAYFYYFPSIVAKILVFPHQYDAPHSLIGDLQFALRYEGVNLEILGLLFDRIDGKELADWLNRQPQSAYARRLGFLHEWLGGPSLDVRVPEKVRFVTVLDDKLQFGLQKGERDKKFRVVNNLPGTTAFCPLARRTPYIDRMLAKDLRSHVRERLSRYDPKLLARAAAFLYLKETQSSFDIEREKPSATRAQRFADLLRDAETEIDLSEEKLVRLQNAVVDPRFSESSFRREQNWIGKDLGSGRKWTSCLRVRKMFHP